MKESLSRSDRLKLGFDYSDYSMMYAVLVAAVKKVTNPSHQQKIATIISDLEILLRVMREEGDI